MIWLLPAALSGFVLLAVPFTIHLFTRRQARRVPFPTIRFLRESPSRAVRPRRPSDLGLLLLRMGIVAAAVIASARPLFLSPWRVSGWNARLARAIVVDTSASMTRPDAAGRTPLSVANAIADAEGRSAYTSYRVESPDLGEGLRRALRQLEHAPPARKEVVVLSDFQQGTVGNRSIATVPAGVGLRFVRAGTPARTRAWTMDAVDGWRGARWEPHIAIDESSTTATWTRAKGAELPAGLTVAVSSAEETRRRAAVAAATALSIPVTNVERRLSIAFRGAARPEAFARAERIKAPWIVRAAVALAESDLLDQAVHATGLTGEKISAEPWTSIARDVHGADVVVVAEHDGAMLIDTTATASSLAAPALIRAALLARGEAGPPDEEVLRISDDQLSRWGREPAPIGADGWQNVDGSDARWFWAAALVLVLIESLVRRRGNVARREEAHVEAA